MKKLAEVLDQSLPLSLDKAVRKEGTSKRNERTRSFEVESLLRSILRNFRKVEDLK